MSIAGTWGVRLATGAVPDNRLCQGELAHAWLASVSWVVGALPATAPGAFMPSRRRIRRGLITSALPITSNGNGRISAALLSLGFSQ